MHKLLILLAMGISGCSSGITSNSSSTLEVRSLGLDQKVLRTDCSTIVCTDGFANEGDIWMTDIPVDQLRTGSVSMGQIIHLQILWTPTAGKTPLASTSTNLAIEHIIIVDGEIGIYGGGGYCWPEGTPETGLEIIVEEATIALQHHSAQFADLLTPATMEGRVRSQPDPNTARLIAAAAKQLTQ